jgi:hypothetical protein
VVSAADPAFWYNLSYSQSSGRADAIPLSSDTDETIPVSSGIVEPISVFWHSGSDLCLLVARKRFLCFLVYPK